MINEPQESQIQLFGRTPRENTHKYINTYKIGGKLIKYIYTYIHIYILSVSLLAVVCGGH